MTEVIDSIVAELIARDNGYIETFDRATAAHSRFKASVDKLKVQTFDLAAEGQKYKQGVNGMAQAEEQSSARMIRAKKNVSDATKAKADAEKAAARAIADAAKTEQKAREAAERASAKAAATAKKEAEAKAAAAKAAADAVIAAAAREEAARVRLAAVVERSLADQVARGSKGTGALFGSSTARIATQAPAEVAPVAAAAAAEAVEQKEVNALLVDQAVLQAGITTARGKDRDILRDQITELRLIATLKRAGLTDEEAAIKAEATLAAIETERAAVARKASSGIAKNSVERFAEGAGLQRTGGSTAALSGIVAASLVAGVVALTKAGLGYAQSLKQESDQLGLTTHDLQVYQAVAQQAGVKTEQFKEGVGQLASNLGKAQEGSEQQGKIFSALNIDIGNAKTGYKSLSDVLPTLVDRLSQIPDKTRRFAIETALGGEQLRKLDPILSGGTDSFNKLAASIEATGGLLSDEQIQNADKTALKLQNLGDQLERDLAGAVANNAGAIETLATAFFHAAEGALKFFSAMTNSGNLDILNSPTLTNFSSRLLGNDPEKTRSQAFTDLLANPEGRRSLAARNAAALNELNRVDQLHKVADANMTATTANGVTTLAGGSNERTSLDTSLPGLQGTSDTSSGRYAAYVRLNAERQRILAADRTARAAAASTGPQAGTVGDTSKLFAPKGPKGKSAEALENERLQRERQFNDQLARSQEELLRSQESQTADVNKQADIEKNLADRAYQRQLDDIETQRKRNVNSGADVKLEDARAAQLRAAAADAHNAELSGIEQQKQIRLQQAATAHLETSLSIESDTLSAKLALAQTAKERRDIELQLLENARKQKEAELNGTINNPLSSPDAVKDARTQLKALPSQTALQAKGIDQRDAGPLASYLQSLPDTAAKINEALQSVQVDGLQKVEDGIAGVISGTESLKDAFHSVAASIIADLAKIAIEKAIAFGIGAITGTGGLNGSSMSASSWASANASFATAHRASGGNVVAGVPYVVGEHRPEVFIPAVSGRIAPDVTAGGRGGSTIIHAPQFNLAGAVVTTELYADMQRISDQSSASMGVYAAQAGAAKGKSDTFIAARRPQLPGSG